MMTKYCLFLFILYYSSVFSQSANKLEIHHLTGDFYIYVSYNLYKGNPVPANGMYVVTTDGVILIDSPFDTTQFQPLLDSIQQRHHKKVTLCIATHSHNDRTAGLEYYRKLGIKTYTTQQTDALCKKNNEKRAEFLIRQDTIFNVASHPFETFYPGHGHAPDNIVIWFKEQKILYGGCFIKSVESTDLGNVKDANVKEWKKSIKKVQDKFKQPAYVIPGHYSWKDNSSPAHTLNLVEESLKNK